MLSISISRCIAAWALRGSRPDRSTKDPGRQFHVAALGACFFNEITLLAFLNPDNSTDWNPDCNSNDDGIDASGASDILPVDGKSGSAGNPHDSSKVFDQPGLYIRGTLLPLWSRWVPR